MLISAICSGFIKTDDYLTQFWIKAEISKRKCLLLKATFLNS
jgi:hypothetical protein